MSTNPFLEKVGLSKGERVVIFHADDIGMCHASVEAYKGLIEFGLLSSAATMVPCPWFPQTAAYLRDHQAQYAHIDMGVHLTFTSEWDGYRWGAISGQASDGSLADSEGYFYRSTAEAQQHATAAAVTAEIRAQVERATAAGIDITHIDSHMGTIFAPEFLPAYFQLASEYQIPPFVVRPNEEMLRHMGSAADSMLQTLAYVQEMGFPVFDHIHMMSLGEPENRLDQAKAGLDSCPAGLSMFLIHPCIDTPELRAIAPDWRCRVGDYELFRSEAWRTYIEESGVHVIGYRQLRDAMRGQ